VDDFTRDILLRGASIAGDGAHGGLDVGEVADALSLATNAKKQKLREQQRKNRGRRAERAGNNEAAEAFLRDDSRRFQSTGKFVEEERYPDPFGIERSAADPEAFVGESDEVNAARQRGGYVQVDKGQGKQQFWRERGRLFTDRKYAGKGPEDLADPFVKPRASPRGQGMGGPNGLATQLADMVARGEVDGNSLVPGSQTRTINSLIQDMAAEADPQLLRDADREVARQTRERDAANYSPTQRAISDELAQREALTYITNSGGYIGDINRIDTLGLASKKFNRGVPMDQFNVVQAVDPNTFDNAIQMIGPDGQTVGYSDNQDRFIADVNLGTAESITNAPTSRMATWMEGNLPNMGRAEGGINFGTQQTNPGDELGLLSQRLGPFAPATGIRGIADLENAVRAVTVDAAFRGSTMWNYQDGQKVAVQDPGIDEVLYKLGYSADEKTRLASALQSVEAAMLSDVNRNAKEMYAAGLTPQGNAVVSNNYEKDVQLSRMPSSTRVNLDGTRTSVRGQLSGLDASEAEVFESRGRDPNTVYTTTPDGQRVLLPEARQDLTDARIALDDAQRPFQAAPQGSQPEDRRYLSAKSAQMTPVQRRKTYGAKGDIGTELQRRADAAEADRLAAVGATDPIAAEFRARDAEFEAAGQARREQDSYQEKIRLRGGNPLQAITPRINSQQATSAVGSPSPDPIPLLARGTWVGSSTQGQAGAPVDGLTINAAQAQSVAPNQAPLAGISYNERSPDPWMQPVGSGNGITQEIEKRTGTTTQKALPYGMSTSGASQGPTRPVTNELKGELAALSSGFSDQGPRPASNYSDPGIKPDGPSPMNRERRRRAVGPRVEYNRDKMQRRAIQRGGRGAAAVGGGVAGIAGLNELINGERNNRNEEQY